MFIIFFLKCKTKILCYKNTWKLHWNKFNWIALKLSQTFIYDLASILIKFTVILIRSILTVRWHLIRSSDNTWITIIGMTVRNCLWRKYKTLCLLRAWIQLPEVLRLTRVCKDIFMYLRSGKSGLVVIYRKILNIDVRVCVCCWGFSFV